MKISLRIFPGRLRTAEDAHKTTHEAPKTAQDAHNTHPKTTPSRFRDGPRCPQDAHKTPQEAPKTPQDEPKTTQDAPGLLRDASRRLRTSFWVPLSLDFYDMFEQFVPHFGWFLYWFSLRPQGAFSRRPKRFPKHKFHGIPRFGCLWAWIFEFFFERFFFV